MSVPNYIPSRNYLPGQAGMPGFMPPAIGGYWNQMAQQMAGPMYMPPLPSSNIPSPIRPPAPPQTFTPGPVAAIPNGAVPGALNPVAPGMPSQLSRLAGGGGPVGAPSGARTIQAFGSAPYIGSATTWGIDGTAPASPFMGSGGHPIGYFDGTFGTQVA